MGILNSDKDKGASNSSYSRGEQKINDGRYKARNRLIGAVVLVILAIIFIPMLFSNKQSTQEQQPPLQPLVTTTDATGANTTEGGITVQTPEQQPAAQPGTPPVPADATSTPNTAVPPSDATSTPGSDLSVAQSTNPDMVPTEQTPPAATGDQSATSQTATTPPADQKDQSKAKSKTSSSRIADKDRTDDGRVARAILDGKPVPQSKSKVTSGSYDVQVASLSSMGDARGQRDKLRNSGVSNAYIQEATVNGSQVYRLRIGPFDSKEAAQAAQTRVRALNFSNSIVVKH